MNYSQRIGFKLALRGAYCVLLLTLASCSWWRTAPPTVAPPTPAPPTQPQAEPLSRYGNPEFYDVFGKRYFPLKSAAGFSERGVASWYGPDFHGGLTSTREPYDMYQMTAAHKTLPLPTWVEVVNLSNGRKIQVRVNDRGPFKDNRIIDLSYAAAIQLDMIREGTAMVEVRALTPGTVTVATAAPIARAEASVGAAPSPSVSSTLYLQLGAFADRANADRLKAQLEPSFVGQINVVSDSAASNLYKVRVGPLRDVAASDKAVATLEALGISDHHFVSP